MMHHHTGIQFRGIERMVTTSDGVSLSVRAYGPRDAAHTVVLLHGLCLNKDSWTIQIEHLLHQYGGARMLYIHPDECVDCGACEPVCPVEAIYYEDDLPDHWSGYTQINADFFTELGSPGGASKIGITENDPIAVKSLDRVDKG
jgi:NAD-dependent dihydropyrimidine dehydrogenase PreA subunit